MNGKKIIEFEKSDEKVEEKLVAPYRVNTTCNNHVVNLHILKPMADAMLKCFGPYGYNSRMDPLAKYKDGEFYEKPISRDGVSILSQIRDIEHGVLGPFMSTLKSVSARNDAKGGDGTTSTILFLYALYKYATINKIVDTNVVSVLTEYMDKLSHKPIAHSELVDSARVSLNNDSRLASVLQDMFNAMDEAGMDWKNVDIIPVKSKDFTQEKIWHEVSSVAKTHACSLYHKKIDETFILYCARPISDLQIFHTMNMIIQYVALQLMTMGYTKLVIACPSIDKNLIEATSNIVNHLAKSNFMVDYIEFFNPMYPDAEGSELIAIASGIPSIDPYGMYDFDENGTSRHITIDMVEDVKAYIANTLIPVMPIVDLDLFEDHTNIVVKEHRNEAPTMYKKSIVEAVKVEMRETKSSTTREKLEKKLRALETTSAVIYIAAPTEDGMQLLYDMYKDACLQMHYSRKGIIAAGMIGISRVITTILADKIELSLTCSEVFTLELLRDVAIHLNGMLFKLKDIALRRPFSHKHSDIASDICMTAISCDQDSKDACKGFDVIEDKVSHKIVTSAHTELNIIKSALDIVSMWMNSNQIVWRNEIGVAGYEFLMTELKQKDPYEDLVL